MTTCALRAGGIVLAAGASRRMGLNKLLLKVGGESLLRRSARQAIAGGLSPVIVVLRHDVDQARAELAGLPCDTAVVAHSMGRMSDSLHTGLSQLERGTDAAVVLLADMVFVSETMVAALVERARQSGAPLVVSRYDGVTAPPLLFQRELFGELLRCTGERCGKATVDRHRDEASFIDWPARALTDINTLEDLARLEGRLVSETPASKGYGVDVGPG